MMSANSSGSVNNVYWIKYQLIESETLQFSQL